jgi:FkbM family methyltransferase
MNFDDFYSANKNSLKVFCEVGVYFWNEEGKNYCRLEKQVNDNKIIILIEPLPRCVENIKQYTKNKTNIILYPYAISNQTGKTFIYDQGAAAFINEVKGKTPRDVFWPNSVLDKPITIQTITFDKIDPGNIDVLFIDTEGSEYFVLENMVSRPKVIAIETHFEENGKSYRNPYFDKINKWITNNNYLIWYTTNSDTFYLKK